MKSVPVVGSGMVGLTSAIQLQEAGFQVRFEFDAAFPTVFHNYGHGDTGFTVAWGCAIELAGILKGKK